MKINLHFPPEMPTRSGDVLTFHYNVFTGHIYCAINSEYSIIYNRFNCYDEMSADLYEERKPGIEKFNESVIAWAYMDEVAQGVFDEIHG